MKQLMKKMQQMVSRGVVNLVSDSFKMQQLQVEFKADDVMDDVERFQQYGFTSSPLAGAEAIGLTVNGAKSHTVVIAVDDKRYRLKQLAPGEVALYDDQEQKIVLQRDKILVESGKVVINSDDIQLGSGDGEAVARVGDFVRIGSGSSQGDWPIISGSSKVSAS
jgi:phage baseplate assembly protein V